MGVAVTIDIILTQCFLHSLRPCASLRTCLHTPHHFSLLVPFFIFLLRGIPSDSTVFFLPQSFHAYFLCCTVELFHSVNILSAFANKGKNLCAQGVYSLVELNRTRVWVIVTQSRIKNKSHLTYKLNAVVFQR